MSYQDENCTNMAVKSQRKKEMKVLVMGMGRTGTRALASGLEQCGFTPYHYVERFWEGHFEPWNKAMRAKFHGVGKPWGRREFDQLTGDFDVILDVPCCLFAAELCEAYPEAKVILNWRDADEWLNSMKTTLFHVFQWPSLRILRYTDPKICGVWCQHNDLIWNHFCDGEYTNERKVKQRYAEHYDFVRQLVLSDRLLEYDIKQGWTPITKFLELPEFTGNVERNSAEDFIAVHTQIWRWHVRNSLKNLGVAGAVIFAVIASLTYGRSNLKGYWLNIARRYMGYSRD